MRLNATAHSWHACSEVWTRSHTLSSSIRRATDLMAKGEADAVVSAGNTGAVVATMLFVARPMEGVDRPPVAASLPSVLNTSVTWSINNSTSDIVSMLQYAKFQAVKTSVDHRIRFYQSSDEWFYILEELDGTGNWAQVHGIIPRNIDAEVDVTVDLPDLSVEFSSIGVVTNFSASQKTITLHHETLEKYQKPDLRVIDIYAGGSITTTVSQSF